MRMENVSVIIVLQRHKSILLIPPTLFPGSNLNPASVMGAGSYLATLY